MSTSSTDQREGCCHTWFFIPSLGSYQETTSEESPKTFQYNNISLGVLHKNACFSAHFKRLWYMASHCPKIIGCLTVLHREQYNCDILTVKMHACNSTTYVHFKLAKMFCWCTPANICSYRSLIFKSCRINRNCKLKLIARLLTYSAIAA